jgi:hypothetical protein
VPRVGASRTDISRVSSYYLRHVEMDVCLDVIE